jgi:hypothetical protein
MPLLSKPSSAAFMAILYITLGALIDVWTGIWYWYLKDHPPEQAGMYYWCAGFFLTGLTLLVIGLALGRIGRAALHAELPPSEATPSPNKVGPTVAGPPQVIVPTPAAFVAVPPQAVPNAPQPGLPAAPLRPNAPVNVVR